MAAAGVRQDKPPAGGYPDFRWTRSLRNPPSFMRIFLGGLGVMTLGFAVVIHTNKERRELKKEKLNARLFLLPLIQAEEDRRILRAMKAFEEEEALIMKDVPGWKVGESMYNTEKWIPPNPRQLKQ